VNTKAILIKEHPSVKLEQCLKIVMVMVMVMVILLSTEALLLLALSQEDVLLASMMVNISKST
jgi:hypothetical protein